VDLAPLTADRVLVVNAGSSSLKLRLLDAGDGVVADRQLDAPEGRFDEGELREVVSGLDRVDAVGHRVVHGGRLTSAARLDPNVLGYLRSLADLAPLHQPASLAGIDLLRRLLPDTPAVACFDTAFHATLPAAAATYALPRAWREQFAIRRYGFHGLSHAYASRRAAEMLDAPGESLRLVTCHLGAGASLAAVRGGVSVDTTMGFTPLEGLVMATRSGTVDPGLVLWLQTHAHVPAEELTETLEHGSGLKALAGSPDMRELLAGVRAGSADARLALDVYVHRLRASIAAMAAATVGLDALVFTGGVGERSAEVRQAAAAGLGFLGVALDEARNAGARPDAEVSLAGAAARVLVIEAREDLEVARQVREVLRPAEPAGERPARPG
jgi:acetate kinase